MNEQKGKQKAKEYYDQEAADYVKQYQKAYDKYPANLIRIKFIIERMKKKMVTEGKRELKRAGFSSELINFADLEKGKVFPKEKFDAIIALGVFPHILNEKRALLNMKKMLKPKGLVFIE